MYISIGIEWTKILFRQIHEKYRILGTFAKQSINFTKNVDTKIVNRLLFKLRQNELVIDILLN